MTSGAGTCQVKYDQPGEGDYNLAPQLIELVAAQKANQMITAEPLAPKTYGDSDVAVNASASSGLPVSFTATGSCTISGAIVHITGAGSCAVTAAQAGDANYNRAPSLTQTFAIAKADQTIAFEAPGNKTYGDRDFALSATASSGLVVSFAASGKCTVNKANVHLTGPGSCTLTARQPGDANYNAAPAVSRSFAIARPPCRVPRVIGKRLAEARAAIAKAHCRMGSIGYGDSRKRKKGVVLAQNRPPGKLLQPGARIDLVVGRGPRR
jgi:hypothetical protein